MVSFGSEFVHPFPLLIECLLDLFTMWVLWGGRAVAVYETASFLPSSSLSYIFLPHTELLSILYPSLLGAFCRSTSIQDIPLLVPFFRGVTRCLSLLKVKYYPARHSLSFPRYHDIIYYLSKTFSLSIRLVFVMEDGILAKGAKIIEGMFLDTPKDPLVEAAIEAAKKLPPDPNPVKFRHLNVDTDTHQYDLPTECLTRPGYNSTGQGVLVNINSYAVAKFPDLVVYQYDVSDPSVDLFILEH